MPEMPLNARRSGNTEPFTWNAQRKEVAKLLAVGELTEAEISVQCKLDQKTIYRWKQIPDFWAAVLEIAKQLGGVALRYAVGRRERRIRNLNDRLDQMYEIIRERAAEADMQDVPGGQDGPDPANLEASGKR